MPFMWLDYASEDAEPESGKAYYLFTEPSGMPVRVEDAAGLEVWRAELIDAYGEVRGKDGAECPTRLRFAGHFRDEDLGLFYNRFRDYDPELGRYLQPDPLGHAGGINLFAYSSNPLVEVDLRGLAHKAKKAKGADADGQGGKKKPAKEGSTPPTPKKLEGLTLKQQKARKPKNSPDIVKWRKKGGTVDFYDDGTVVYSTSGKPPPKRTVPYKDGYPDFGAADPPCVKASATIDQKGNHSSDYRDANSNAGLGETTNAHLDEHGDTVTWHHHQDGKTMQLVDRDVHDTFKHRGGVSESKKK